ncbi:Pkinase-domain-containing protein [Auricularia subglabra TFB-10046 SS5]|nr:Pkinase-domain-containing protein [Auricularia subglabra TFB-10046 SS5]
MGKTQSKLSSAGGIIAPKSRRSTQLQPTSPPDSKAASLRRADGAEEPALGAQPNNDLSAYDSTAADPGVAAAAAEWSSNLKTVADSDGGAIELSLTPASVPSPRRQQTGLSITSVASVSSATQVMALNSGAYAKFPPPPRHPLSPQLSQTAPAAMPAPQTVPCQYRTGKTLGSGTYAVVKEAVHIKTGKYYACKVINKKLMEGREHMVRNEIAVLKKVSSGHRNIVTLHDYFETAHNLYLVFDLCTGGELFDRICAKGNYYEADAADLVRTILKAVQYIHNCGIVHRDLKPENLLFRSPAEDADIMIADFGLSRVMDDEKFKLLTEICGTPGYMAPEIFRKLGHGKPVDIWAMGVITYFLLCGYTPFDRDTQQEEMEAIIAGDYKFEPKEYWANVSDVARDFVRTLLNVDPTKRPSAAQALEHPWLASLEPHFVPDPTSPTGGPKDLLPNIKVSFNARKTFRKAILSTMAMNRLRGHAATPRSELAINVDEYKKAAEEEHIDDGHDVVYGHPNDGTHSRTPSTAGTPTSPRPPTSPSVKDGLLEPPTSALERTKLSDE